MSTFANLLKECRRKSEFTFRALSEKTGIPSSVLFKYERSLIYPKDEALRKICTTFNLNFDQIKIVLGNEKKARVLKNSTYPLLRQIFVDSYNAEYAMWKKEAVLSEKKLRYEFSSEKIHPIEEKLIEETDRRLHEKKSIKTNESIVMDKFSSEQKKKLFKTVITDWGYNPASKQLIIGFEVRKGLLQTVCYTMKWSWERYIRKV